MGTFDWPNGTHVTFTKWVPEQPDTRNILMKEDHACVGMKFGEGPCDDISCARHLPFVCEKKAYGWKKHCAWPLQTRRKRRLLDYFEAWLTALDNSKSVLASNDCTLTPKLFVKDSREKSASKQMDSLSLIITNISLLSYNENK